MYKHAAYGHKSRAKPIIITVSALLLAALIAFAVFKIFIPHGENTDENKPSAQETPEIITEDAPKIEPAEEKPREKTEEAPQDSPDSLALARELIKSYRYDEALSLLENQSSAEADALRADAQNGKNGLVLYEGQVFHVFFHSLIVDTSLAFDNKGHPASGYNQWMTTVSEFKKMLPLFLENDFILFDITQMCEIKDGAVTQKPIYLPAGKKPLVISIDDVNYYDYMKPDGFAERLDVDENGRVVTIVNGKATYDGDVMPILDDFVSEHPEFSFRGAKGIVATTGYAGAFGYRITDLELYSEEEGKKMLDKVTEVANALRASGWQIANHSYTHNQYWNTKTITMDQLKYDTGRWVNEIMPYVGQTPIFISPFGVTFDQNDERYQYLVGLGFNIYCPVGAGMRTAYHGSNVTQERLNLDGYTMIKHPERVSKYFFDPALVLDPSRPPMD